VVVGKAHQAFAHKDTAADNKPGSDNSGLDRNVSRLVVHNSKAAYYTAADEEGRVD
jgi:hypothetical protein